MVLDRRQVLASIGLTGLATLGQVHDSSVLVVDDPGMYVLSLDLNCLPMSELEVRKLQQKWEEQFKGPAPRLVILPPGVKLNGPLPGRYSVYEQLENYERTVTFQTKAELDEYLSSSKPTEV